MQRQSEQKTPPAQKKLPKKENCRKTEGVERGMKKLLCILLAAGLLSFAAVHAADAAPEQKDSLEFGESRTLSDPMNFEFTPVNIAMNDSGMVAVSFKAAAFDGVLLFSQSGKPVSEFHFQCSGSFFVELEDAEIVICTVRGDHKVHYNLDGVCLFREDFPAGSVSDTQAVKTVSIECPSARLVLKKSAVKWELYLNDTLIMRCRPLFWAFQNGMPFVFMAVFFPIWLYGFRKQLHRMKKEQMGQEAAAVVQN